MFLPPPKKKKKSFNYVAWLNLSMQDFDPVSHILEHIPPEENDLEYFEKQVLLQILCYYLFSFSEE